MATSMALDDTLLRRAMKVGGMRTKRATVTVALEEFVQRREQKNILSLAGKISFRSGWEYKKERRARGIGR